MLEGADTNWEVFVMLMKDSEGEESIAGFAAVHSYFTWPNKRRLRVSQLAVLPPFRRQSVASTLLELIRTVALEREYIDVTFEDPSDQLLNIRSVLDTSKVQTLGHFLLSTFPCHVFALAAFHNLLRTMMTKIVPGYEPWR